MKKLFIAVSLLFFQTIVMADQPDTLGDGSCVLVGFNENGGTTLREHYTGLKGTLTSGPIWSNGPHGWALEFISNNPTFSAWVDMGVSSNYKLPTGNKNRTHLMVVYPTTTTFNTRVGIMQYGGAGAGIEMNIQSHTAGVVRTEWGSGSSERNYPIAKLIKDKWNYLFITDESYGTVTREWVYVFVDGELSTRDTILSVVQQNTGTTYNFAIGANGLAPASTGFGGKIAFIGVWKRTFTEGECADLYAKMIGKRKGQ